MNILSVSLSALLFSMTFSSNLFAKTNEDILLKAFHKNSITKCDKFIKKHSRLNGHFNVFISKHDDGIDGKSTEVSIVTIYGEKGNTIKFDDSYIQTAKNCVLHSRSVATKIGSCDSIIDTKKWFRTSPMPKKDYSAYKYKLGYDLYAKELTVGDSKICIMQASMRINEYKKGEEPKRR